MVTICETQNNLLNSKYNKRLTNLTKIKINFFHQDTIAMIKTLYRIPGLSIPVNFSRKE